MECTNGWLQPLLARIASDRSVISVPLIDTISSYDMTYQYNSEVYINGFNWALAFNWYVYDNIRHKLLHEQHFFIKIYQRRFYRCTF